MPAEDFDSLGEYAKSLGIRLPPLTRHSKGEFGKCLDKIEEKKQAGDWEGVERACDAALGLDKGARRGDLRNVAKTMILVVLRDVGQLSDLAERLDVLAKRFSAAPEKSRDWLKKEISNVDKARLNLASSNDKGANLTSACSALRGLGRADLGAMAATRALELDSDNQAALVSRAAARLDEQSTGRARADLSKAWKLGDSSYCAVTMSRCARMEHHYEEAVEWGGKAMELDPGPYAANVLLAAGAAAGDKGAMQAASQVLHEGSDGQGTPWLAVKGAEILVRFGETEAARAALELILAEGDYRPAQDLLGKLNASAAEPDPVSVNESTAAPSSASGASEDVGREAAALVATGQPPAVHRCSTCGQEIGAGESVVIRREGPTRVRLHRRCA